MSTRSRKSKTATAASAAPAAPAAAADGAASMDTDQAPADPADLAAADSKTLESKVSADPGNYDLHLALVRALKEEAKLSKLRKARNAMAARFPLPESVWLDWIEDEDRLAQQPDEKQAVLALYERAVKDYLAPAIWQRYVEYAQEMYPLPGDDDDSDGDSAGAGAGASALTPQVSTGINVVRSVLEQAVSALGSHFKEGAALWSTYRSFEQSVYALVAASKPAGAGSSTTSSSNNSNELKKQEERVRRTFTAPLSTPLQNTSQLWKEYADWEKAVTGRAPTKKLQDARTEAVEHAGRAQVYEDAISEVPAPESVGAASPELLAAWDSYIQAETALWAKKHFERIMVLHERKLAQCFLSEAAWEAYIDAIRRYGHTGSSSVVIDTIERAIRNCPWSVSLWRQLLHAIEHHHHTPAAGSTSGPAATAEGRSALIQAVSAAYARAEAVPLAGATLAELALTLCEIKVRTARLVLQSAGGVQSESKGTVTPGKRRRVDPSAPTASSDAADDHPATEVDEAAVSTARSEVITALQAAGSTLAQHMPRAELIKGQFHQNSDELYYRLSCYSAEVHAKLLRDVETARSVWEEFIKLNGDNLQGWQDYIRFESVHGTDAHVSKAYERLISILPSDWTALPWCSAWQRHEHQWGTPASMANAQSKLFTKQREVELKMSKVQQQAEADRGALQEERRDRKKQKKIGERETKGAASVDDADEADGGGAVSSWQDGYPPVPQGNKGKMGLGARSSGPKRGRDETATATAAAAGGGAGRTETPESKAARERAAAEMAEPTTFSGGRAATKRQRVGETPSKAGAAGPAKWQWGHGAPADPPTEVELAVSHSKTANPHDAKALDAVEAEELKQPAAGAAVYGPPRPPSKQHPLADVTASAAPEPVAAEPHDMEVDEAFDEPAPMTIANQSQPPVRQQAPQQSVDSDRPDGAGHGGVADHTVFVLNIPFDTTQDDLKQMFEQYGVVVDVRIPTKRGKPVGRAFVEMDSKEAAAFAIESANGADFKGRKLDVRQNKEQKANQAATVFVRNLPKGARDLVKMLNDHFIGCGELAEIRVAKDRQGNSKNFAYVEFKSSASVPAALKLDYSTMDDGDAQSMIRVEPCKQPGDRTAGPRGTGGASSAPHVREPVDVNRKISRSAMIQFVPRVVHKPAALAVAKPRPADGQPAGAAGGTSAPAPAQVSSPTAGAVKGDAAPTTVTDRKSNDDFRKMLFAKK